MVGIADTVLKCETYIASGQLQLCMNCKWEAWLSVSVCVCVCVCVCARTHHPLALTCSLSLFLWDADLLGMAGPCTSSYAIRSRPKSEGYTFTLFTAPPLGTKELTSTAGVGGQEWGGQEWGRSRGWGSMARDTDELHM